jgi:hypothetical protein
LSRAFKSLFALAILCFWVPNLLGCVKTAETPETPAATIPATPSATTSETRSAIATRDALVGTWIGIGAGLWDEIVFSDDGTAIVEGGGEGRWRTGTLGGTPTISVGGDYWPYELNADRLTFDFRSAKLDGQNDPRRVTVYLRKGSEGTAERVGCEKARAMLRTGDEGYLYDPESSKWPEDPTSLTFNEWLALNKDEEGRYAGSVNEESPGKPFKQYVAQNKCPLGGAYVLGDWIKTVTEDDEYGPSVEWRLNDIICSVHGGTTAPPAPPSTGLGAWRNPVWAASPE